MTFKAEKDPRIVLSEVSDGATFVENFGKYRHGYFHTHLFCHRGNIQFLFRDKKMKCKGGEFLFWFADSKLKDIRCSNNFKASVLFVEKDFLTDNNPDQSWTIDSLLYSREHPVKTVSKEDKQRILKNFQSLHDRCIDFDHRFYEEVLKRQMQIFIFEMWHTFANVYEHNKGSVQTSTLYEKFIQLLETHCLKERVVKFYANQLNITPKYLNHICKTTTGIIASQWIQRYTRDRLILLLENKNLNIAEISDTMEFSSRSFFTRYVKKMLGVTPRDYRKRLE